MSAIQLRGAWLTPNLGRAGHPRTQAHQPRTHTACGLGQCTGRARAETNLVNFSTYGAQSGREEQRPRLPLGEAHLCQGREDNKH
jgi:hypothetical protein